MTNRRRTPTRDHDLRMHLGVILMAMQMISRPPCAPLTSDQQELIEIIRRAAKAMETLLDIPPLDGPKKKSAKKS
jgi:light-regulated signal transduction histidine kinase (bacteriophytochrome)